MSNDEATLTASCHMSDSRRSLAYVTARLMPDLCFSQSKLLSRSNDRWFAKLCNIRPFQTSTGDSHSLTTDTPSSNNTVASKRKGENDNATRNSTKVVPLHVTALCSC